MRISHLFDETIKGVLKGTLLVGIVQAIGIVVSFLSQIILARTVGPEIFGMYSFVWSLAIVLGTVLGVGLPTLGTRLISQGFETGEVPIVRGVSIFGVLFPLGISSIITLLFFLILPFFGEDVILKLDLLSKALILLPSLCVILLLTNYLKAWGLPAFSHVTTGTFIPLLLLGYSFYFHTESDSIDDLIIFLFFGLALLLIIELIVAWHGVLKKEGVNLLVGNKVFKQKQWLNLAFPLLILALARVAQTQADILILGFYADPIDLGSFSASKRVSMIVGAILMASNSIVVPKIARLYKAGKIKELQTLLTKITSITWIFSAILGLFLALFSTHLLSLFDPSFASQSNILTILILGQIVNVGFGPTAFLLSMTGNEKILAKTMVISMFITTIAMFFLVSEFGILGAAYGSALCITLWNFMLWVVGVKVLNIDPSVIRTVTLLFRRGARYE